MLEILGRIDKEVFLYFNGKYTHFSDQIWLTITNGSFWIPLYLVILLLTIRAYKKESVWIFGGIFLVILATDQVTASVMKPFFERLRPCHNPELAGLVHVAKTCGGKFGFASSHAANTFGVAMFFWLVLKNTYPIVSLLFAWSSLVAISRVMIGVHYPGDILAGALVGIISGWIIYQILLRTYKKIRNQELIKS